MIKEFFSKKFKGFGLAEVLVGLAITGGALITITSISLSAYRQVKDNESGDLANNVMLMSIEYFKTPISDITKEPAFTLNNIPIGTKAVLKIKTNTPVGDAPQNLRFAVISNPTPTDLGELTDCDATNTYVVSFKDPTIKFVLCNKLVIEKTAIGYNFTSYVAYRTARNDLRTSRLIGYRQKL